MLGSCLEKVRAASPLVHNITNYVTVNDVANAILAVGGSPIMSDDGGEVEEIASVCAALNINIGTLNQTTIPSMFLAGRKAAELGRPTLLDPVGAGASRLRTETAARLAEEIPFSVIRGNSSEIKALASGAGGARGVDADSADAVTEEHVDGAVAFVKQFAARRQCVVAVTGAIDLVADASRCFVIRNGRAEMGRITGTGCQLSGVIAAFIAANPGNFLNACAAAVAAMGVAGEIAWERMADGDGNSTYRNRIIDALYTMTGGVLDGGARYEVR